MLRSRGRDARERPYLDKMYFSGYSAHVPPHKHLQIPGSSTPENGRTMQHPAWCQRECSS